MRRYREAQRQLKRWRKTRRVGVLATLAYMMGL
jgi:hypothetical protein